MLTIKDENKKPLRKALDVYAGIDIDGSDETPWVDIKIRDEDGKQKATYVFSDSDIAKPQPRVQLMDLHGEGFLNDGHAEPVGGAIGKKEGVYFSPGIYANAEGKIVSQDGEIRQIHITSTDTQNREITVVAGGRSYYGTDTIVITEYTPNERVFIDRICYGRAMRWDNNSIIKCNLNLRAVETKAAEPTLQKSQIELEVYEKEDLTDYIGTIPEDTPIWYMSGYPTDMSPIRYFYISDTVQQEGHVLSISGEDATKFLEGEYSVYKAENGGVKNYIDAIREALTKSNISHTVLSHWDDAPYTSGKGSLLWDNRSKRVMIATLVNLLRTSIQQDETHSLPAGDDVGLYLKYVDAGIPTLSTDIDVTDVYEIEDTTIFNDEIERKSEYQVEGFGKITESATWETVETLELESGSSVIKSLSEPYIQLRASNGTLTQINPFTYTIKGAGASTITGRRLYPQDAVYKLSQNENTVDAGSIYINGTVKSAVSDQELSINMELVSQLERRSNKIHSFTWRGDPHLQPRDFIRVNGVVMTIDTITLDHEEGGLKSTITAREGYV